MYQRGADSPSHTCTATVALLLASAFPALVTYLPAEATLRLHTVDSLRELKNRARGAKGRRCEVVIQDARPGLPIITSWADQRTAKPKCGT